MPSVRQIIDWVDRKYPNQETDANKVIDLNDIHNEVYVKLARLRHMHSIYEDTTIADQLVYNLPSDCTIDEIITIKVSRDVTITDSTEWDTFSYAGLNDDCSTGNYYSPVTENTYCLIMDDNTIQTAGLTIQIFYYPKPTQIDDVNDTPGLESQYHNLLKYGLCQSLASQGHNPDTDIADYWQRKYDEFYAEIEGNLSEKYNSAPLTTIQSEEWW